MAVRTTVREESIPFRPCQKVYIQQRQLGASNLDGKQDFYCKGKKKALNLLKDDELCPAFKDLVERFDINPEMVISLEKFVCKLYGQKASRLSTKQDTTCSA